MDFRSGGRGPRVATTKIVKLTRDGQDLIQDKTSF